MGFIETAYSGNTTSQDLEINSDLNLKNEYDLIGVKRFVCLDYLGPVKASASNDVQKTIEIDITADEYSEMIRIPSNFVSGSVFRVILTAAAGTNPTRIKAYYLGSYYDCFWVSDNTEAYATKYAYIYLYKYDAINDEYTELKNIITQGTVIAGEKRYVDISGLKGGDYLCVRGETVNGGTVTTNKNLLYLMFQGNKTTPGADVNTTVGAATTSSTDNEFSVACDMEVSAYTGAVWD